MFDRRFFLKSSALAMVGVGATPGWLSRALYAADAPSPRKKVLVAIFQRGAVDGLNVVVPHGEKRYYEMRPPIAIPRPNGTPDTAIDLDGMFGLHPSLSALKPIYDAGQLAVIEAVGSPDTTRSHFDAQDYMESGTPGTKATDDGWLNRTLQRSPESDASPFRAVAKGASLPLTLRGVAPAIALPDIKQFRVFAQSPSVEGGFEALYAQSVDQALRGTGTEP